MFFTNRTSRKASELAENPRAALVLHWYELGRQVRVEGEVEEVDEAESEEYWRARPRGSQIAAWASPQSQVVASRRDLDGLYHTAERELGAGDVPLPHFWGGYRVVPETIELWYTVRTACTTAFATGAQKTAGRASGSRPELRAGEGAVGVHALRVPQHVALRARKACSLDLRPDLVQPVVDLEAPVLHPGD